MCSLTNQRDDGFAFNIRDNGGGPFSFIRAKTLATFHFGFFYAAAITADGNASTDRDHPVSNARAAAMGEGSGPLRDHDDVMPKSASNGDRDTAFGRTT
ncbi:MAG: hypothetical protein ACR2RA_00915 [Geminicoccaceae bacterium]